MTVAWVDTPSGRETLDMFAVLILRAMPAERYQDGGAALSATLASIEGPAPYAEAVADRLASLGLLERSPEDGLLFRRSERGNRLLRKLDEGDKLWLAKLDRELGDGDTPKPKSLAHHLKKVSISARRLIQRRR